MLMWCVYCVKFRPTKSAQRRASRRASRRRARVAVPLCRPRLPSATDDAAAVSQLPLGARNTDRDARRPQSTDRFSRQSAAVHPRDAQLVQELLPSRARVPSSSAAAAAARAIPRPLPRPARPRRAAADVRVARRPRRGPCAAARRLPEAGGA